MKQPPFRVTLRNGDTAMITSLGECDRLFPIAGYLLNPPAGMHVRTEQWRSDGRWCCDGHDHRWDIVAGLADTQPAPATAETTEAL